MRAISLFNWLRSRSSRVNDVGVQRAGRPGLAGSLGLGMGRGSTHTVLGMEVRVLWQTRSAARHEATAWAFHGKVRESHFWLSFFSPHNCYLAVPCPSCLSLHLAICFGTFPCSFDIARLSQPTNPLSCFPAFLLHFHSQSRLPLNLVTVSTVLPLQLSCHITQLTSQTSSGIIQSNLD